MYAAGWRANPRRIRITCDNAPECAGSGVSDKLPRVDCRQLIGALERAGFEKVRQRGRHLSMRRASDNKRVTVPVHKGRPVPIGTLHSILRDAGIADDEFRELLA
ncbi:MAG: type II toxin-antitoxin system HicA family toxin [Chloroflexia bacterium]